MRVAAEITLSKEEHRITLGLLSVLTFVLFISPVRAQIPSPIDLGIRNIPQETQVWCWAAVAQGEDL